MWQKLIGVNKVGLKAQSMVTYNIQLAIGTPAQPMAVIFDTGSFMLAVFAEPPPAGMKPLLKDTKKQKLHATASSSGRSGAQPRSAGHAEDAAPLVSLAQVSAQVLMGHHGASWQLWGFAACSGGLLVALLALVVSSRRRRACASAAAAAMEEQSAAAAAARRVYGAI